MNGFIKLHRKLIEWGWYSDCVVKDVFLHILMTASFRDGQYLGYEIRPGDAIIGTNKLSTALGFSPQQIRTALKKLESTGEISIFSTNRFSIATVVNWGIYQGDEYDEQQTDNIQATNNQQTDNKRITFKQQTDNIQATFKQQHLKNVNNIINKECKESNNIMSSSSSARTREKTPQVIEGKIGKGVLILSDEEMTKLLALMPITEFDKYCTKLSSWIVKEGKTVANHYELIKKWYMEDHGNDN